MWALLMFLPFDVVPPSPDPTEGGGLFGLPVWALVAIGAGVLLLIVLLAYAVGRGNRR